MRFSFIVFHFSRAFLAIDSGSLTDASSVASYTGSLSSPVHAAFPFSMFSMSCISFSMSFLISPNILSAFAAAFASSASFFFQSSRSAPSVHFTMLCTFTLLFFAKTRIDPEAIFLSKPPAGNARAISAEWTFMRSSKIALLASFMGNMFVFASALVSALFFLSPNHAPSFELPLSITSFGM